MAAFLELTAELSEAYNQRENQENNDLPPPVDRSQRKYLQSLNRSCVKNTDAENAYCNRED